MRWAILAAVSLVVPSDRFGSPPTAIDWQDSSPGALCGGPAPVGWHPVPEVHPGGGRGRIILTVRQQLPPPGGVSGPPSRLCYTFANADGRTLARAPVLRVAAGQKFSIRLVNRITDSSTIDGVAEAETAGDAATGRPDDSPHARGGRCTRIDDGPGAYPRMSCAIPAATGATNLHTHGLNVSPEQPGDEVLRTCVNPVRGKGIRAQGRPGCADGAWTYTFTVPADQPPGLYWYHPHFHGEAEEQVMLGLSGAIVVEPPNAVRGPGLPDDVMIVRDVPLHRTGEQSQPDDRSPIPEPVAPARHGEADPRIAEGAEVTCPAPAADAPLLPGPPATRLSLNDSPIAENDGEGGFPSDSMVANLTAPAGTWRIWRILNGSANTFIKPHLTDDKGRAVPMLVLAQDGTPLPRLTERPSVLLSPAGRIELLVQVPSPGGKLYLDSAAVDTGCAGDGTPARRLAMLTADPTTPAAVMDKASVTASIDDWLQRVQLVVSPPTSPLSDGFCAPPSSPVRKRTLALTENPRGSDDQDFYITELSGADDRHVVIRPFSMPMPGAALHPGIAVSLAGRPFAVEDWTIQNYTNELHSFHIHQLHFREIVDGKPEGPILDTITVPTAEPSFRDGHVVPGRPGEITVRIAFDRKALGDFVFHCHLLEHEDNGMMGTIRVSP